MRHMWLASGQFASYWNVFLLDAAYAYTRINSNKTYRVTDESSFMSERRKQEGRHFLDQSVFSFGVKIYKLVRWCNIAYHILRSYLYSYWKDNIPSDKMLFHCVSLLVLVFVTTSQGYYQEMGRRASSVEKCLMSASDDYRPGNAFTTEDGCYECEADSNCKLSCTPTNQCPDTTRSLHCLTRRRVHILKGCYTCWEDAGCNLSCTRNERCVDKTEQCMLNGQLYDMNEWQPELSDFPELCMCKFDFQCVISRCKCTRNEQQSKPINRN